MEVPRLSDTTDIIPVTASERIINDDLLTIGNNVTISYGVYFACHGKGQAHLPIVINDGAYIGMRTSIISKNKNKSQNGVSIGKGAVIGACSLVNTDVPDGAKAVGTPIRILEKRDSGNGK